MTALEAESFCPCTDASSYCLTPMSSSQILLIRPSNGTFLWDVCPCLLTGNCSEVPYKPKASSYLSSVLFSPPGSSAQNNTSVMAGKV